MKMSIRTKFGLGMFFMFLIILILIGFSAFYLNNLSGKTSAILKENYLSVGYAREMTEGLTKINNEVTTGFLERRNPNKKEVAAQLELVKLSLELEKANITEVGEDKLAKDIETGFAEYSDSVARALSEDLSASQVLYFQKKTGILTQQLVLLSKMNEKAIETKTDAAKASAKNALTGMSILGSICFLIALSFIYSFASYFNERFFQLYNGIKEIVSSNYGQRLYFDGVDEFYELSLLFNQMAEKLSGEQNPEEKQFSFSSVDQKQETDDNAEELKDILLRIKNIERQAEEIISKMEKQG
jgi:hypothetical protein